MVEEERQLYTEADAKLKRIHQILTRINECKVNLLKFDESTEQYNYLITFNLLNNLLSEIYPKLSRGEKDKEGKIKGSERIAMEKLRGFILKLLIENTPHHDTKQKTIKGK